MSRNRKPTTHASLSEELAWFAEPERKEPTHHTTHVLRRSRLDAGGGMLPVRGRDGDRPVSDYVGSTLKLDRDGCPVYGGGKQMKAQASDSVAARRAAMGGATPDGKVELANW